MLLSPSLARARYLKEWAVVRLISLVHFLPSHITITLKLFKIIRNKLRKES